MTMSTITVRIPTPLRDYTHGSEVVEVAGATVGGALAALGAAHHGVLDRILGPEGELRPFVNLFLDGRNVRELDGLRTALRTGDIIAIVPAIAGGNGTGPPISGAPG